MAIREIIKVGNNILGRKCRRVDEVDEEVLELIKDLKDTLYSVDGVGLAAPQIGVLKKVFLIDLRDGSEPLILLNPRILKKIGRTEGAEGCLSYPGYEGMVVRPRRVIVTGMNEKGETIEVEASGLHCTVYLF